MFFESVHSTGQNFFKIISNKNDKGFSLHIHKAFECYAVTKGRAEVKIDGKIWTAKSTSEEDLEEGSECLLQSIEGVTAIVSKK